MEILSFFALSSAFGLLHADLPLTLLYTLILILKIELLQVFILILLELSLQPQIPDQIIRPDPTYRALPSPDRALSLDRGADKVIHVKGFIMRHTEPRPTRVPNLLPIELTLPPDNHLRQWHLTPTRLEQPLQIPPTLPLRNPMPGIRKPVLEYLPLIPIPHHIHPEHMPTRIAPRSLLMNADPVRVSQVQGRDCDAGVVSAFQGGVLGQGADAQG